MNRIRRLEALGQSAWLDFLDRRLLTSGELERMVSEDGLSGVTSNPTIFQKAIAGSSDYDALIRAAEPSEPDASVLERIMVRDLALACDVLRPVYDRSGGADGFASIEVAPTVASDTGLSVEHAFRLWESVDRPNLMVKIPGTRAGLPAIESCLLHGINVNVTLLFSVSRYREVVEAHCRGLERRRAAGKPIDRVASVASFFVSRVDTKVDRALDELPEEVRADARALRGRLAIANAKLAYEACEHILATDRFRALAAAGGRPARLLWASTSPKDPALPLLYYVEALIGRGTVDTMTPECFRAYLERGEPEARLGLGRDEAHAQIDALRELGVDLGDLTEHLEDEGVASFADSYRSALATIKSKRRAVADARPRA